MTDAEKAAWRAGYQAGLQAAAALCDQWHKLDAKIGARKAAIAKILGPDWPDDNFTVAEAREWAAVRQYTAQGLADAIRALPLPEPPDA